MSYENCVSPLSVRGDYQIALQNNVLSNLQTFPQTNQLAITTNMATSGLSDDQLAAIVTIERVCSSLSLIGCAFIVVTFLSSRAFHRPINRLVFYASVGNIMTNIATIIGRSAIENPTGALCQVQGFLIQM